MLATSSAVAARWMIELGRRAFTKAAAASSIDWPACFATSFSIASTPSEIVDEDVGGRLGADERVAALGRAEIGGRAADHRERIGAFQSRDRLVDRFLRTSVDHHGGARLCEPLGNGETDTRRRAGDDGSLVREIDFHQS